MWCLQIDTLMHIADLVMANAWNTPRQRRRTRNSSTPRGAAPGSVGPFSRGGTPGPSRQHLVTPGAHAVTPPTTPMDPRLPNTPAGSSTQAFGRAEDAFAAGGMFFSNHRVFFCDTQIWRTCIRVKEQQSSA